MNNHALVGRVGTEPELRYTPDGKPVLNFRLAVDRGRKKPGTEEWLTDWFSVAFFGDRAPKVAERLIKGELAEVVGFTYLDEYTDRGGVMRAKLCCEAREVRGLLAKKPAEA